MINSSILSMSSQHNSEITMIPPETYICCSRSFSTSSMSYNRKSDEQKRKNSFLETPSTVDGLSPFDSPSMTYNKVITKKSFFNHNNFFDEGVEREEYGLSDISYLSLGD